MRLLVLDFLRRQKQFYKIGAVFLIGSAFVGVSAQVTFQSIAVMIFSTSLFGFSREIYQLPVSRKEIWRARWALALAPAGLSLAIRLALWGISASIGRNIGGTPSWILLSSFFPLIYLGAVFAVSIPISKYVFRFASMKLVLAYGAGLGIAVMVPGPMLAQRLPRQLEDWTGETILMLAVGSALTAIAFFHEPRIAPRLFVPFSPAGSNDIGRSAAEPVHRRSGLTGLPSLISKQIRLTIFAGMLSGVVSELPVVALAWFAPGNTYKEHATVFLGYLPVGAALLLLHPIFMATLGTFFAPELLGLRHLRVLPVSNRSLAAILVSNGVVFWLSFWVLPVAGHCLLFSQWPPTFRLDLLALLAGLTTVAGSAAMLSSAKASLKFFVLPFLTFAGLAVVHFLGEFSLAGSLLTGIVGLLGVAVSFVGYERALRRSSTVYKSKIPAVGFARPRLILQ